MTDKFYEKTLVFVKQYRKAAEAALVEVIAGGLEPGEDPVLYFGGSEG